MNKTYIYAGVGALALILLGWYFYKQRQAPAAPPQSSAPVSASAMDRVLKLGDPQSPEVSALQRLLGFDLRDQTGIFDANTESAVMKAYGKKAISLREAQNNYITALSAE